MKTASSRLFTIALLLVAPCAFGQASAADLESARALRKEAKALKLTDPKAALAKFKAAHALARTAVTGAELAEAHLAVGEMVEARDVAVSVVLMPIEKDETALSTNARKQASEMADALKTKIPSVRLNIERVPANAPGDLEVTIDGQRVPSAALGEPRKVNPGLHNVTAQLAGGEVATGNVDVKEGETAGLDLKVNAPTAPAILPPPVVVPAKPQPTRSGVSPLLITGIILGGAGLVVGSVAGFYAMSKRNELDDTYCPTPTTCRDGYQEPLSAAKTAGTVSTIGFVAAGVGGLLAVGGLVLGGKRSSEAQVGVRPWIGAGSVGVNGAF